MLSLVRRYYVILRTLMPSVTLSTKHLDQALILHRLSRKGTFGKMGQVSFEGKVLKNIVMFQQSSQK